MNEQIFKPGDFVRCAFYGDRIHVLMSGEVSCYPVEIHVDGGTCSFTEDGRSELSHTHPVLTLVERPKKSVRKGLYQALLKSGDEFMLSTFVCASKERLSEVYMRDQIVGIVEVEVELDE